MQTSEPILGFTQAGLSPEILAAITKAGFTTPTPIQAKSIPVALTGKDIIGIAQTGTGKTMAFSLPILDALLNRKVEKALIIVPTRELALQVEESIRTVTRFVPASMRTAVLIGGAPMFRQIQDLKNRPRIIVATPGRLRDHMDRRTVHLSDVGVLVLDEADRMLDMGFAPQITRICEALPKNRQTLLFSATFAGEVAKLAANFQIDPVRVEVATQGTSAKLIEQEVLYVRGEEKSEALRKLLQEHAGTVLVFSRTKHGARKLTTTVTGFGHTSTDIHSNKSLSQRRHALEGFKTGRYRVLVATDVASRGIDVKDIQMVINYDLPDVNEDYVHRIGRTGRAGSAGKAVSLATPDQKRQVQAIERLIGRAIPVSAHSTVQPQTQMTQSGQFQRRNNFRGQPSRGQSSRSYSHGSHSSSGHSNGNHAGGGHAGGHFMTRGESGQARGFRSRGQRPFSRPQHSRSRG